MHLLCQRTGRFTRIENRPPPPPATTPAAGQAQRQPAYRVDRIACGGPDAVPGSPQAAWAVVRVRTDKIVDRLGRARRGDQRRIGSVVLVVASEAEAEMAARELMRAGEGDAGGDGDGDEA